MSTWEQKYPTVEDKLDWVVRVAKETQDLLTRRSSTDWDFQHSIKALKRGVDKLAEQVGR